MSLRVGVLASGEGSNLQAILDTVHGEEGVEVVAVASNRAAARALERARGAAVETAVFARDDHPDRASRDRALADWLTQREVQLVVLAGYMELLSPDFVVRFRGRLINVHPALLPSFPGLDAIGQAIEHGVRVTGVTVHFVDEGVDTGPIILQEAVELGYAPDPVKVAEQVHEVEHGLLPRAIRMFAAGAISIDQSNPRRVRIDEPARS